MYQSFLSKPSELHRALERERPRLVWLCTSWLGDAALAEDVVQETLLEAWRKIETLREPAAFSGWLSGIARNMALRRLRKLGRDAAVIQAADGSADILSNYPAEFDFEVALDRADLARLLERALGLLPDETRTVLVQKYIEEMSHSAIAGRLGVSENVVAVRLHRGKVALRKVLVGELQSESADFGLITAEDVWQETRIWCTTCGARRLLGRLDEKEFALRCRTCNDEAGSYHTQSGRGGVFDGDFKTFRPALKLFSQFMDGVYQRAVAGGGLPCSYCGRFRPLRLTIAHYAPPSVRAVRGLHMYCYECESGTYESLDGLALNLPEGQAFFQAYQRIRSLPQRVVEHEGVAAVVIPFAEVGGRAAFDVVVKEESYETIAIYRRDD